MKTSLIKAGILILTLSITLIPSCNGALNTQSYSPSTAIVSTTVPAVFNSNYDLWSSKHITDYSFDIRISAFFPGSGNLIHIEVRDGIAQGYNQETQPYQTFPDMIIRIYDNIEKLFAQIKDAYENEADTISVSYDSEFGFPNHADVDPIRAMLDEQWGFTVTDFTPLTNGTGN